MANMPNKETRTRLWEALLKIENAHAFKLSKWEDKFDRLEGMVTEHIIKLLVWGNSISDMTGWSNTIVHKALMTVAGKRVELENGTRPITKEEYKKGIFDAEMSEPNEFKDTIDRITYNLVESDGYILNDELDYFELWQRYCKVRDELLDEMCKTIPSKLTMKDLCEHFTIWNYANTY